MSVDKEAQREKLQLEKQIADLRALVDTLQTALRRADNALKGTKDYDYVFARSAQWAMNEKI